MTMETFKDAMTVLKIILKMDCEQFKQIAPEDIKAGDLLLRGISSSKINHAGIYCGNGEVIEFSAAPGTNPRSTLVSSSSSAINGQIHKIAVRKFNEGKKLVALRLKSGPPEDLAVNIYHAMGKDVEYNAIAFNCVHFALCILKELEWPSTSVEAGAIAVELEGLNQGEDVYERQ